MHIHMWKGERKKKRILKMDEAQKHVTGEMILFLPAANYNQSGNNVTAKAMRKSRTSSTQAPKVSPWYSLACKGWLAGPLLQLT